MVIVDDFEDGDVSDWSVSNGSFNASSNGYMEGTYEGSLLSNQAFASASKSFTLDTYDELQFSAYIQSVDGSDITDFIWSGDTAIIIRFDHGSGQITVDGTSITSWSATTVYTVNLRLLSNGDIEVRVNGTLQSTITPSTDHSSSSWNGVEFGNDTYDSGSVRTDYVDNIRAVKNASPPSTPQNVDATYVADDQIDLTWDEVTDWGGETGSYEIQILRDNGTWSDPSGGVSSVSGGSASYNYSYGPNSDTAYGRQVGIDSSFQFRIRATNSAGSSSWSYSDTVYTTPVPPHNPSVSRPDATTFDFSWYNQADHPSYIRLYARRDQGSGYGSWTFVHDLSSSPSSGSGQTVRLNVGDSLNQVSWTLQNDERYQFALETYGQGGNTSELAYTDYGNNGNVYFSDDFESGGTSNWDTVSLSDANSGVKQSPASDSSGDLAISGADSGSYFIEFQTNDYVTKNLGDLSSETDVIVKCAMAAGSLDSSAETVGLEWYDGSAWQNLQKFSHEYNRQGWVEVSAAVPSSWLSTDNRLRLMGYGGSGDYLAVDRVVVSDILHEYTKPAAPSGLSLTTPSEGEIAATWTSNTSLSDANSHFQEFRQRITNSGDALSKTNVEEQTSYTTSGLKDGEKYDIRVDSLYQQFRRGSTDTWWRNTSTPKTAVTILPAPTSLNVTGTGYTYFDTGWTGNHNYGSTSIQYRQTGATTWNEDASVNYDVTTETISNLQDGTDYELRVVAETEHTSSLSSTISARTYLNATRSVSVYGTGNTDITARNTSKSRTASVYQARSDTVVSSRMTTSPRISTNYGSGSTSTSRASYSKTRVASIHGSGATASAAEFSEVFPSESSADLEFDMIYDPVLGFASEWVYEESVFGDDTDAFTVILDMRTAPAKTITVRVQYDSTGNGVADYTTDPLIMKRDSQVFSIDELGDDGWYRIILSDMRPPDYLRRVTWGPTRF